MKVSVIIVSYNQPELLRQALESVQQSRAVYPVETIVIDNGSALSFAAWLRADFPTVRLIENRENLGFSRANNQGAVIAGGEYLLFLNNDARVEPDTIAQMVGRMDEEPQIGVLGPLLLNPDGSFQLSYGRRVSFFSEFDQKYFALARERRRLGQPPRRDLFQPVVWVSGACLLTRRGYFPDGRVFDENMFLYFEDHELCLRLASLGKRIVYWSAPAAFHQGGGSAVRKRLPVMIEYRRSELHLYSRHGRLLDLLALRVYLTLKYSLKLAAAWRRRDEAARECRQAYRTILRLARQKEKPDGPAIA